LEHLARHRPVQRERRGEVAAAQAGHERGGLPVPVRGRIDQALAARVAARTVRRGPGLVEELEAARIHIALPAPPAPSLASDKPVLLGGP